MSLVSLEPWRAPSNYHLLTDVPENLTYDTIAATTERACSAGERRASLTRHTASQRAAHAARSARGCRTPKSVIATSKKRAMGAASVSHVPTASAVTQAR